MVTILPEYAGCYMYVCWGGCFTELHTYKHADLHPFQWNFNFYFCVFRLPRVQVHVQLLAYFVVKTQDQGLSLYCIVRLRCNLQGLTATFEEVLVAIGTALLAAIHSNKWLFSVCINVLYILAKFWDLACWPRYCIYGLWQFSRGGGASAPPSPTKWNPALYAQRLVNNLGKQDIIINLLYCSLTDQGVVVIIVTVYLLYMQIKGSSGLLSKITFTGEDADFLTKRMQALEVIISILSQ